MWSGWIHRGARLLCAWTLSAWIAGCGGKVGLGPAPTPSEPLNATKPNANARINSQNVFGDPGVGTSLYSVRAGDDGSFGYRGTINSELGVGILNAGGAVRWFRPVVYAVRDVRILPGTSFVPHGLVVAGAHDTDHDGQSEVGYLAVYKSNGDLLSQVLVASDTSDIWVDGIESADESTFVACGGERRSNVEHPWVALLRFHPPGVFVFEKTVFLRTLIGPFTNLAVLSSAPGDLRFAATLDGGLAWSIHGLRASLPGFDPVVVEWSHDIVSTTGPVVDLNDLVAAGGNVYVALEVDDNRKPAPTVGGLWNSGLVESYAAAGAQRWHTVVSLTQGASEGFQSVSVASDVVYAVGYGARYQLSNDTHEVFGYGLISKLSAGTGQEIANFTIGNDHYESGFNSAIWTTSGLFTAGFTEEEVNGGPYRGWLCNTNVSGTIATDGTAAGAETGAGPATAEVRDPARGRERGHR
jgi:hypothetical protein